MRVSAQQERPQSTLNAVIAPIGGGGLMSGTCIAAHGEEGAPSPQPSPSGRGGRSPHAPWAVRVFAAEPAGADDAARSLATGRLHPQDAPKTIADGLLTGMSELTFSIVREHVERIVTVSEDQIIAAMRLVWERMKIIIEPSSAVPVAAVLSDEFKALAGIQRVGVILSGGNVDLDKLPWIK